MLTGKSAPSLGKAIAKSPEDHRLIDTVCCETNRAEEALYLTKNSAMPWMRYLVRQNVVKQQFEHLSLWKKKKKIEIQHDELSQKEITSRNAEVMYLLIEDLIPVVLSFAQALLSDPSAWNLLKRSFFYDNRIK
uniref:Uncharacterized protein n=1 Tax=Setaria digitata TaxID=48799 RepID=A0A915PHK6_9BILA